MANYSIGIDIGGTNSEIGLVDLHGRLLCKNKVSTTEYKKPEVLVEALYDRFFFEIKKVGEANIKGIGIGAPNGNFYTGNIEFAPNLNWKGIIPLAKMVSNKFKLPTQLTNDANAAAIGEMQYGAAKGMKDFIMVTLGTGVGSGFVANGQLIYGHDGFAGELGHVIAVRDGRACGCGRNGCLETYSSATGIVKTAYEFLKNNTESSLNNEVVLSSKTIYDAALQGDELALKIFDFTGKILGQCLADAVAITSPQAIILFGGLAQAKEYILNPTKNYMEENLLSIYKNKIPILLSTIPENDAAILGAAALAWN